MMYIAYMYIQYVGSTCTPFRNSFNNHKACGREFMVVLRGFIRQSYSGILPVECVRGSLRM